MPSLEDELLSLICTTCNIAKPTLADFDLDRPLIGPESQLGIDSLDAVELVVTIHKKYGARIESEERSREVLATLNTLTTFVTANKD